MERYAFIIGLICASGQGSPFTSKQYRSDYEYNKHTDAFYKFHTESRSHIGAKQCCQIEGADLMLPVTQRDIQQVHAMFKRYPDLADFVLVASDNQEHDPVEEPAILTLEPEPEWYGSACQVLKRDGEVADLPCWRQAPFVCKVGAQAAPYDETCNVFGRNYVSKIALTGSCYKIPDVAFTWNEAFAECAAENAHLVVLNSEGEREVVRELMNSFKPLRSAKEPHFFFAGIRADHPTDGTPRVFRTVLNQTLEEAGYTGWTDNEPNNARGTEYCGSLFKNDGKYNDLTCSHLYAFICEKEMRVV